jgi:hypothetical protein
VIPMDMSLIFVALMALCVVMMLRRGGCCG